jgi:hypothetical protein
MHRGMAVIGDGHVIESDWGKGHGRETAHEIASQRQTINIATAARRWTDARAISDDRKGSPAVKMRGVALFMVRGSH